MKYNNNKVAVDENAEEVLSNDKDINVNVTQIATPSTSTGFTDADRMKENNGAQQQYTPHIVNPAVILLNNKIHEGEGDGEGEGEEGDDEEEGDGEEGDDEEGEDEAA